ncbi:MAG: phosphatase [Rhodospirillales bacterium]|nr:phosphatase [Rhodospirillales bacterium]
MQNDEVAIRGQRGWFIVHACKDPYHRQALGYTTPGAPKNHPEYLFAARPGRLILNLVDVDKVSFIAPEILDVALRAIRDNVGSLKVLVHCNLGMSRSPTIVLLYLLKYTDILGASEYTQALKAFQALYPSYSPAKGMADYAKLNWEKYLPTDDPR